MSKTKLTIASLSFDRWDDLVSLFGERGACGGCWCMAWRFRSKEFEIHKGARNRAAFRRLVKSGREPGILGYLAGEPVAWAAVAPRCEYARLETSRVLAAVDDRPVWSLTCFFIRRDQRRAGRSVEMLRAACAFAAQRGAKIVEGYPVEPRKDDMPAVFAWTGIASAFKAAGFREVARRAPTRPIMRRQVRRRKSAALLDPLES